MVLVAAEQLTKILLYFPPANFLFASRESSKEFSEAQEADTRQKHHKHSGDIDGSTRPAAHGQPYPFSATHM